MCSRSSIDTPRQLDEALSLLSHRYRRYVLRYLDEQSAPVTVNELARYVSEQDRPTGSVTNGSVDEEAIRLSLHHTHLPKLAAEGIITFDSAGSLVDIAIENEELIALLEAVETVLEQ